MDRFFERSMPNAATQPLFDQARELRHRLLPGLCGTDAAGPALQHRDPRRPRRRHRRPLPQDPPARPCRPQAAGAVPAPREALLRGRRRRLQGVAHHGLADRHVHLQRPALAGDLPGHGPAGRRGGGPRLQHAVAQHPLARAAAPAHVPPPPAAAGACAPERTVGGRRRQMWCRGRLSHDRRLGNRLAHRRDRRAGVAPRTTKSSSSIATLRSATPSASMCSISRCTAGRSTIR